MATQTPVIIQPFVSVPIRNSTYSTEYTLPSATIDAAITIFLGQFDTTAPANGTQFILQGNPFSTGSGQYWENITTLVTGTIAAVLDHATGSIAAGATTIGLSSSNALGWHSQPVFVGSATAGEWITMTNHSAGVLTLLTPIVNAYGTNATVTGAAFVGTINFDPYPYARLRLLTDNTFVASGTSFTTGPTIVATAFMGATT